jgi:hypothetical protein
MTYAFTIPATRFTRQIKLIAARGYIALVCGEAGDQFAAVYFLPGLAGGDFGAVQYADTRQA